MYPIDRLLRKRVGNPRTVAYLFPNFLKDVDEYRRSEAFWSQLCNEIVNKHGNIRDWATLDADPFLEGNPMLDWMSPLRRKGIRIIQEEVRTDELDMGAWTNTRGGEPGEEGTWDELVVSCALSKESAELARRLLIEWAQFEGSREDFEPTIERILKQVQS